jgi:hypothetical protein
MKIVALVNGQGYAAPLKRLDKVQCRFESVLDRKGGAVVASKTKQKTWPSFGIEDGTVQFTQPSWWFLEGRTIASFECQ